MEEHVDQHHTGQVVVGVDGRQPSPVGRTTTGVPSDVQVASPPDGSAEGRAAMDAPLVLTRSLRSGQS